jgi:hypothetical protein
MAILFTALILGIDALMLHPAIVKPTQHARNRRTICAVAKCNDSESHKFLLGLSNKYHTESNAWSVANDMPDYPTYVSENHFEGRR